MSIFQIHNRWSNHLNHRGLLQYQEKYQAGTIIDFL